MYSRYITACTGIKCANHVETPLIIIWLFFFADPPEIELETDRVHSGENKEAHLTCLIHGNPTPSVSSLTLYCTWFFAPILESPNTM